MADMQDNTLLTDHCSQFDALVCAAVSPWPVDNSQERQQRQEIHAELAHGMANQLEQDNPKFDRNKFLTLCGIEEDDDMTAAAECEHIFVNGICVKCSFLED